MYFSRIKVLKTYCILYPVTHVDTLLIQLLIQMLIALIISNSVVCGVKLESASRIAEKFWNNSQCYFVSFLYLALIIFLSTFRRAQVRACNPCAAMRNLPKIYFVNIYVRVWSEYSSQLILIKWTSKSLYIWLCSSSSQLLIFIFIVS